MVVVEFFFRKSLQFCITYVQNTSKCFCSFFMNLYFPSINSCLNTLIINVYLPTDYGTLDSENAYVDALGELDGFSSSQSYDNLILCGDFNVDFSRTSHNSAHLHRFMFAHDLVATDLNSSICYTYCRDDHSAFSWPDHVLTKQFATNLISDFRVVDDAVDHLPVFFNLSVCSTMNHQFNPTAPFVNSCTVNWNSVSDDDIALYGMS